MNRNTITALVTIPSLFLMACGINDLGAGSHPPEKPLTPVPADGSENQSIFLVQLAWSGRDADPNDILKYDIFLDTVNPPAIKVSSSQATTICNVGGLLLNTVYFWKVTVSDGKETIAGDVWQFTTQTAVPAAPPGMRLIPGGTFPMGSPDTAAIAGAAPVHTVTVSSYYIDTTEVAQNDYLSLMGVNPSEFSSDLRQPVERVTWFDALLFCNARSKRDDLDTIYSYTSVSGTAGNGCSGLGDIAMDYTKNGYRLPTEAEWEYACRAGTATEYYWGTEIDSSYCWYYSNSGNTTHQVALKLPNARGLYDMSGNVLEWCNDWYDRYSALPQSDPVGPSVPQTFRILRGGSWQSYHQYAIFSLASAYRLWDCPEDILCTFGIRCVRR